MTQHQEELKTALIELVTAGSIALVTHRNPDGDGLPACLALQELLRCRDKDADIVLERPCHELYAFLDGPRHSRVMAADLSYDCIVLLDCHERDRIGTCAPLVDAATCVIAIDHHHERELIPGAHTYIDTEIVSAGGILWELFASDIEQLPAESRRYLVEALYTTVLNDTDNFVNANTDARTFEICRQMAAQGLEAGPVARRFVWGKTAMEMKFVGEVLAGMQLRHDGRVLFLFSTLEMLDRLNLDAESTSKITRWVKGVRGVEAVVYFREIGERLYRLSLRSDVVDVNRIARLYGGGGHTRAAGCEMSGSLDDIQATIYRHLEEQL
ncbi:MAG: DHH family phosphoesterase [Candidatus Cloacimonetes bacterium]|nr:DHH family phosphoesterase [Candidatus Cloacimonadota bacterium]